TTSAWFGVVEPMPTLPATDRKAVCPGASIPMDALPITTSIAWGFTIPIPTLPLTASAAVCVASLYPMPALPVTTSGWTGTVVPTPMLPLTASAAVCAASLYPMATLPLVYNAADAGGLVIMFPTTSFDATQTVPTPSMVMRAYGESPFVRLPLGSYV